MSDEDDLVLSELDDTSRDIARELADHRLLITTKIATSADGEVLSSVEVAVRHWLGL